MKRAVILVLPSLFTAAGGVLAVAWLLGAPWWVGLLGLGCDAADGWVARRLGAASSFGAAFDLTTDSMIAALILARNEAMWGLPILAAIQAWGASRDLRVSGRWALTIGTIVAELGAHALWGTP